MFGWGMPSVPLRKGVVTVIKNTSADAGLSWALRAPEATSFATAVKIGYDVDLPLVDGFYNSAFTSTPITQWPALPRGGGQTDIAEAKYAAGAHF